MSHPSDRPAPGGIAILGTKTLALRLVEALVAAGTTPTRLVTWDDSGDVRSRLADLEEAAGRLGVPFTATRRSTDAYEALLADGPTLVLVAGWYRLIPDEVLDAAPRGFVGAHYSPLPRYRGSAPVVWQLINGEAEAGYSLFRLGPGMDEGELAGSGRVPTGDGYVGEVLDLLDAEAISHLVRIAPGLADGTQGFEPQPEGRASYASMRRPDDGHIDWTRPALEIVRAIRAQSHPYPGAWSTTGDTEVRIWRASVEDGADYHGVPGHVVRVHERGPVIACGDRSGVLLEQFDGPALGLASRLS